MQSNSHQGLVFALAGFAILSVGDAVIKSMSGDWPVTAVAALRFSIGAVGLSALLLMREGAGAFRPANPLLQLGRGACLALASVFFFASIFVMPLAETTSIVFVAPILTAFFSKPLLGEEVRPATWLASIVAFAGVLIVLRPNLLEVGWFALLPLVAAVFFSLMIIANRASAGTGSPLAMQVYISTVAAAILLFAAFTGHFSGIADFQLSVPDWTVVARCAIVAVTASTAHWLVFLGTTRSGASAIAPMTYVQLLVASFFGAMWFDEIPDTLAWVGAAVIIGAGLYLWRDGRKLRSTQTR